MHTTCQKYFHRHPPDGPHQNPMRPMHRITPHTHTGSVYMSVSINMSNMSHQVHQIRCIGCDASDVISDASDVIHRMHELRRPQEDDSSPPPCHCRSDGAGGACPPYRVFPPIVHPRQGLAGLGRGKGGGKTWPGVFFLCPCTGRCHCVGRSWGFNVAGRQR